MTGTEWSREGDAWDFLEALCGFKAESWLAVSSRLHSTEPFRAARRALNALVRQGGLNLTLWSFEDGLETVRWHMSQRFGCAAAGRSFAHATIEAARIATLALLLRQKLGERQFWLLYDPFRTVFRQQGSPPRPVPRVFMKSLCAATGDRTTVHQLLSTRRT